MVAKSKYLSLFDFLVFGIIISAIIFFAYYLLRRTSTIQVTVKLTNRNVLYARSTNPPSWFAEYFYPGMQSKDSLGRLKAEVVKILRYDISPTDKAVYLNINLAANYSKGKKQYNFDGTPLIIGAPLKIELENILVDGLLVGIKGMRDPRVKKEIEVETQVMEFKNIFPETTGIPEFESQALTIGDKITDSTSNVLVEIIGKRVEPAKKNTVDSLGQLWLRNDPLKKDVYLTLKLLTHEINGEYYLFDDIRIKVGESLSLHFKNISIYPTVTKILE